LWKEEKKAQEKMMWVLTALSIVGVILNVRKDHRGFLLWMVTNAAWAVVDFEHGLFAQGVLFVVYFFLALWGWISWKK
jgi:nicotinamide riboside transporter PnuC